MTSIQKALLRTLAYGSIFQFPLTKEELWHYLISDKPIKKDAFEKSLEYLPKHVIRRDELYALAGEQAFIKKRRMMIKELRKKMLIAKRAAYYLSYIPTILFIGISGSLAIENVSGNDDIDFFIITKKKTLFMTRIWLYAVLEVLNLRRKRYDVVPQNKICVNLLISEEKLHWSKKLQDIYTAHEIAQIKPLFERENMYETFMKKNQWITRYLPNSREKLPIILGASWRRRYFTLQIISTVMSNSFFEKVVSFLQKRHMKPFQTTEIISDNYLAFHPFDYRVKTLRDLDAKLAELGLLTKK